MSDTWLVVLLVGAGTVAIKAAGPVLLGGRPLPARLTGVVELLAPALLGALVAVQTFGDGQALTVDARLIGVAAASIALWRKAPLLVVVIVAAAATAIARLAGLNRESWVGPGDRSLPARCSERGWSMGIARPARRARLHAAAGLFPTRARVLGWRPPAAC